MAYLELLGLSTVILAVLSVIGFPLWLFGLRYLRTSTAFLLVPFCGLFALCLFSWYWLRLDGQGLAVGLRILVGGCVAVSLIGLVLKRRTLVIRAPWRALVVPFVAMISVTAIIHRDYRATFPDGHLTASTIWNADLAAYNVVATHLDQHGFDESGSIAGATIGYSAEHDVVGAYSYVNLTSHMLGVPVHKAPLPALASAMFLLVVAVAQLVSRILGRDRWILLVAVASVASYPFTLVLGQYFLSQILGMCATAVLALIVVDVAIVGGSGTRLWVHVLGASIATSTLLFVYPHMVFLGVPFIAGVAGLASIGSRFPRRVLGAMVSLFGGLAVAALLAPARFSDSLARTRYLANVPAGFPLPRFSPSVLLGWSNATLENWDAATVRVSVVLGIIGVLAAAVLSTAETRRAVSLAGCLGLVFVSYAFVYASKGVSYQQWKWITFYQPILFVGYYSLVLSAVVRASRRMGLSFIGGSAGAFGCMMILWVSASNARSMIDTFGQGGVVTDELAALADAPELEGIEALNVELPPMWDTMWAAAMLLDKDLFLVNRSYFPQSPLVADWTLRVRRSGVDPPGRVRVAVNEVYELVSRDGLGIELGSRWDLPECQGAYVFDGSSWQPVFRTAAAGEVLLGVVFPAGGVGLEPLMLRGTTGAADIIGVEYFDGGTARFVFDHWGVAAVGGTVFDVVPGREYVLEVVLDPIVREVSVALDGSTVLNLETELYEFPLATALPVVGRNDIGASLLTVFTGSLREIQVPVPCPT